MDPLKLHKMFEKANREVERAQKSYKRHQSKPDASAFALDLKDAKVRADDAWRVLFDAVESSENWGWRDGKPVRRQRATVTRGRRR